HVRIKKTKASGEHGSVRDRVVHVGGPNAHIAAHVALILSTVCPNSLVKELDAENVTTTKNLEKRNNYHGCEDDVSLDEMNVSATRSQPSKPNQDVSTFSMKKKKIPDESEQISTSLTNAATLLGENIRTAGLELSRSIASKVLIQGKSEMFGQESTQKLYLALCEVEGLIEEDHFHALSKISDHPM
ncbi:hypothetical protein Gogos_003321, partial [Gossypium gossypioides]|nr:hypothetical protein [Gossypium gossypioides]